MWIGVNMSISVSVHIYQTNRKKQSLNHHVYNLNLKFSMNICRTKRRLNLIKSTPLLAKL